MARGAGQGRAGPSQGLAFLVGSFDAFLLTHIPKRRRNKTKSKTSPRLGSPQLDRQFVTCRPEAKTASVLRTKLRVMMFPHNSANPPGTRALSENLFCDSRSLDLGLNRNGPGYIHPYIHTYIHTTYIHSCTTAAALARERPAGWLAGWLAGCIR